MWVSSSCWNLPVSGLPFGSPVAVCTPVAKPDDGLDGMPGPIDLVAGRLAHDDDAAQRRYLTYLAVAQRGDRALLWPRRFRSDKPYPGMVAIAQVKVFNDHSWDLWTPMWQSQLEPVNEYADWLVRIEEAAPDMPLVPEQEITDVLAYLQSVEPLADIALQH